MGTMHDHCLKLGLVRGTKEYKREYNAEKWRQLPYEEKKKKWRQSYESRRRRLLRDPEYKAKERERSRLQKANKRLLNKELVNEKQRESYKNGGALRRAKINAGKRRRNPTIGLANLEQDVRAGRRDPRELIDSIRVAIEQCRTRLDREV